jgi:hypothetical protein
VSRHERTAAHPGDPGQHPGGRFGERAAAWVIDRLHSRDDLDAELVDLRDYPMP